MMTPGQDATMARMCAAARKWWRDPVGGLDEFSDEIRCCADPVTWRAFDGGRSCDLAYAVVGWLEWLQQDHKSGADEAVAVDLLEGRGFSVTRPGAAKPAPVDALEGVVWEDARAVECYTRSGGPVPKYHIEERDRKMVHALRDGGTAYREVNAHARAQLAREAATKPTIVAALEPNALAEYTCRQTGRTWTESATPAAPAVTLEETRRMCREAGDTVVTPSRYARPDVSLAWMLVRRALGDDGIGEIRRAIRGRTPGNAFVDAEIDAEIARLRALGVTPAVLK